MSNGVLTGARTYRLRRLVGTFWLLPLVIGLAGLIVAWGILWLEEVPAVQDIMSNRSFFRLDPDSARLVLSTVAAATISATSIVYSLLLLVRTIATGTLGPRLVEAYDKDFMSRIALGVQLAVFIYCLSILYLVGGQIDQRTLSVAVAIIGGIAALVGLVLFVHSVAKAVHVDTTVARVANFLRKSIAHAEEEAPDGAGLEPPPVDKAQPVIATRSGYVQTIDRHELARRAKRHGIIVVLSVRPGDFVVVGTEVMRLVGASDLAEADRDGLLPSIVIGAFRTDEDDPRFSLQLLVEIALRALSSGINDVYTAVACADHLAGILASLAGRDITPAVVRDREGKPRVFSAELNFQDLADAVFHPLRQSGAQDPVMTITLLRRLADIITVVRDETARDVLKKHTHLIAQEALDEAKAEVDRETIQRLYSSVVEHTF
jgi:uncharacterized membrane protein